MSAQMNELLLKIFF